MTYLRDAWILGGLRTPRGKGTPKGQLAGITPLALVTALLAELQSRNHLQPALIDDLLLGSASQVGLQGANLARTAALMAGLEAVPGLMLNRFCASGLDAIGLAAVQAEFRSGVLIAGGAESVSQVPVFSDQGPFWMDPVVMQRAGSISMGVAADWVATCAGLNRDDLESYTLATRERARAAVASGFGAASLLATFGPGGAQLQSDEYVNYAPTAAEMASFAPAFVEFGAAGQAAQIAARFTGAAPLQYLHTKATSPPPADGAALLLIGNMQVARACKLAPRARVLATASAAVDPFTMLTAGQVAAQRLLDQVGFAAKDLDLVECAEAFAGPALQFARAFDLGPTRMNAFGGTLARGHAFGATGAMLTLQLLDGLDAVSGRYGLVAVSGAAGLGTAMLIERVLQ